MKKIVKYGLITILSLVVLVVAVVVIGSWPQSTKTMERIANQFEADPSWTLVSEKVVPGQLICVDASCDKLRKTWKLEKPIASKDDFIKIAKIGDESLDIQPDCFVERPGVSMKQCDAQKTIEDYRATVNYSYYGNEKPTIVLNVER